MLLSVGVLLYRTPSITYSSGGRRGALESDQASEPTTNSQETEAQRT